MTKLDFLKRLESEVSSSFNFFDYTLLPPTFSQNDKIEIKCPSHGVFEQRAVSHLLGFGCSSCSGLSLSNRDDFIKKAELIHGNRYGYENLIYINNRTKVTITCLTHGDFDQSPKVHLNGGGCAKCAGKAKLSNSIFVARSELVHGKRYDYSLVKYSSTKGRVKIGCSEHGVFEQIAEDHWKGKGCPKCARNATLDLEEFIKRSHEIHGDRYDYSNSLFDGAVGKVNITCLIHGEFYQVAYDHYNGHGCQRCSESTGEREVALILEELGFSFIREYSLPNSRFRYDFYLTDLNILIEFHGKQHYESVEHFGGEDMLKTTQENDRKKLHLAKQHDLPVLVLNYADQDTGLLKDKIVSYMGRED